MATAKRHAQCVVGLFGALVVAQALLGSIPVEAQLDPFFYLRSCPLLLPIVGNQVLTAVLNETRSGASLLRLHFHDCFVNGCDASVLLDDVDNIPAEKNTFPNANSLRGFEIIDAIKADVEVACPGVVSCADILTLAALFGVVYQGGPPWTVPLGRRDAFVGETDNTTLTRLIPSPNGTVPQLIAQFAVNNLTTTDMVALSGAHTIGLARCQVVFFRLYPDADPTIAPDFLTTLQNSCPEDKQNDPAGQNVTNSLDLNTPTLFDNSYYQNLQAQEGLLASDERLYTTDNDTKALVDLYASSNLQFLFDFPAGMIKMGNISPLTGTAGEVRENCRVRNPSSSTVLGNDRSSEAWNQPQYTEEQQKIVDAGAQAYFESAIKKVLEDYNRKQMEQLVEDTTAGSHSAM